MAVGRGLDFSSMCLNSKMWQTRLSFDRFATIKKKKSRIALGTQYHSTLDN